MNPLSILQPVADTLLAYAIKGLPDTIGQAIIFPNQEDEISLCDVAILTLDREKKTSQSDSLRKHFYNLYTHHSLKITDLGSLIYKKDISEITKNINLITSYLIERNIIPIVIGGDQKKIGPELSKIIFHSKKRPVHLGYISPQIEALFIEKEVVSSTFVEDFSLIGNQKYLTPPSAIEILKKNHHQIHGLAAVRGKIESCEPILRTIDILSIDTKALQKVDEASSPSVNGLSSFELCNILNFGGISNNLDCIHIEIDTQGVNNSNSSHIIAQSIWCFIEALSTRVYDYPANNENYHFYSVSMKQEFSSELVFCQSLKRDFSRWWVRVDYNKDHIPISKFIPCEKEDYELCRKFKIIPITWKKWYHKLSTHP